MTNEELYRAVNESETITREVLDILTELDGTASVTTQAELNKLLVILYERSGRGEITLEGVGNGEPVTQEQFSAWVNDSFDTYSAKIFNESI